MYTYQVTIICTLYIVYGDFML